jgi:hypothetical protein
VARLIVHNLHYISMEARDFVNDQIHEFKRKANHNKNESLSLIVFSITCALVAPLFISLGEGKMLEKVIPSILSVLSAGCTSWLQLRKPQKLWSMYRNTQRLLENELVRYSFKMGDYQTHASPEVLLAERAATITFAVHEEWSKLVPNADAIPSKGIS